MHNFTLVCADTDSITICKKDGEDFSNKEIDELTKELNSLYEEGIKWEFEFYLPKMVILKAKNYVYQYSDGNVVYKGSAIKASTKCPALKEFIKKMIQVFLDDSNNFTEIYEEYVQEILNMKDIKRWSFRKTLTDKIFEAKRTNEQKVKDIIEDTEYVEGDRVYCFYLPDGSMSLVENFNGVYCKKRLLKNLYDTAQIFETILDCNKYFKNYALGKYFNEIDPEQAKIHKEKSRLDRIKAKERKDLKNQENTGIISNNENEGF